jgi:4-methylaminobutanoate oxidase (formaldehyde-forming)
MTLASDPERFEELMRGLSMARGFGLEVEEMSPAEVARKWPLIDAGGVVGAIYLPKDGVTNPVDTTQALAK